MLRTLLLAFVLLLGASVPAAALAHSGSKQVAEGTLRSWHGDAEGAPVSTGVGVDTAVAGVVPLDVAVASVAGLVGRRVRAEGRRTERGLALSGGLAPTGPQTAAAATGERRVAVLLFNFAGDTRQPWTPAAARGVVFDNADSVRAYYLDASYGQLDVQGDVFGWFTIDANGGGCAYTTWASEARAAATAAGVPLSGYQYTVYAFPQVSGCGWAGLAYLPGTSSWINGAMSLRVVGHELGHNFGVHHASSLSCTSGGVRVTISSTCTASEYGDPFTIMGSASRRHHVNWHRAQLGWLSDTRVVSTSGIYSLAPAEVASGTPKLLRVARGDGTFLDLELRQPYGRFDDFAATDPAVTGVSVRIGSALSARVQSQLLDGVPATTSFADAPLLPGAAFTDAVSGARVGVVSVSPAGASVSVEFGDDDQPPTTPGSLTATALGPTSIRLSWTASGDDRGVAGYRLWRDGVELGSTSSLTYTSSGLAPATAYTHTVRAFDAAGNLSAPASVTATTPSLDTQPPTAPTGLVATVAKGRKVDLHWNASSDDTGVVGYRVYRGATMVREVAGLTYRDSPRRGTFTYTIRAVDAAGNVSAPSSGVTVTL